MEVILLERIRNLGALGDKVKVKGGFGRNYLIPQRKAVPATADNLKKFEERRSQFEMAERETLSSAEKRAEQLIKLSKLTIVARAADEGKLYGSVSAHEIVEAFNKANIKVEKREVLMPHGALRQVGEYDIDIQLHSDVITVVKVAIIPE